MKKVLLLNNRKGQTVTETSCLFYMARISKRKDEVVKRRHNVKQLAAKRRQALLQSQLLQNFHRDTQEVQLLFTEF